MVADAISAPFGRFCEGITKVRGYTLTREGDRLLLSFEPWFVDQLPGRGLPCLRLMFRRDSERIVLEKFVLCDGTEERPIGLDAAHDALQAWMDYMAD